MADSTISNLTGGTTPIAGTEEVAIVQGGATVKITAQDIADLAGGDNIGNSDLTIDTATRTLTLNGDTASENFVIERNNGNPILALEGDGACAIGQSAVASTKLVIKNDIGTTNTLNIKDSSNVSVMTITDAGQFQTTTDIDRVLSGAGTHLLKLGGALSTDTFTIENSGGTDLVNFRGDGVTNFTGSVVFNNYSTPLGDLTLRPTTGSIGSNGVYIIGESSTTGIYYYGNSKIGNNFINATSRVSNSATGTQTNSVFAMDSGSGATTNRVIQISNSCLGANSVGMYIDVYNGTSNSYAIDINRGDIKTTTSTDRVLSGAGTHKMIMGGALSSDEFTIRNSADSADIFKLHGDKQFTIDSSTYTETHTKGAAAIARSTSFDLSSSTNTKAWKLTSSNWNDAGSRQTLLELDHGSSNTRDAALHITSGNFIIDTVTGTGDYFIHTRLANGVIAFGAAGDTASKFKIVNDVSMTTSFEVNNSSSVKDFEVKNNGDILLSRTGGKIGMFGATPVAQPTTAHAAATLTGGGGTTLTDTDTFDGYTLKQIVKALRDTGVLA